MVTDCLKHSVASPGRFFLRIRGKGNSAWSQIVLSTPLLAADCVAASARTRVGRPLPDG
jgi:hypothetical protein